MNGKFMRLPPNLKEKYRNDFDEVRDKFELPNKGAFELLYPCKEEPDKMKEYSKFLKAACQLH